MWTAEATIDDFRRADNRARIIRLTQHFLQAGPSGLNRLAQLATFRKLIIENESDLDELKSWYLPWYKLNGEGEAGWQYEGSENYIVAEYMDYVLQGNVGPNDINKAERIKERKTRLEAGSCNDEELLVAFDTKLNKRVVLDGCHLAVALALSHAQNPVSFSARLPSYPKVIIEVSSQWAHCLYPCDFIPLLEKCNPNIVGRGRAGLRDEAINELKAQLE